VSFVKWTFLFLGALEALSAQSYPSVIGNGTGLDHLIIGLGGSAVAQEIFGKALGFSALPGITFPQDSLQQALIYFPPAYVELLWPYKKPEGPPAVKEVRDVIESGGGIAGFNVNVSSVESAADLMRRLGLKVYLPPNVAARDANGNEKPTPWRYVLPEAQAAAEFPKGVPGGPAVGFFEEHTDPTLYKNVLADIERAVPDSRRAPGELHANTARKLLSVLVSVPSVAAAVRQSERFGFAAGAERYVKALGEKGREVQCGTGTIVFFEAANPGSALSEYVKRKGLGPLGSASPWLI
jgi:hypothetical protein